MTLNELEAEIAKIKKEQPYSGDMEIGPVYYSGEDKICVEKVKDVNDFVGIHWSC